MDPIPFHKPQMVRRMIFRLPVHFEKIVEIDKIFDVGENIYI